MYVSKAITHLSSVNVPLVLPEIYRFAKQNNTKTGLSGVLAYANGYYLQVIEGESAQVQLTFESILRDDRHSDIITLLDSEIDVRSFGNWSMRLAGLINHNADFLNFLDKYGDGFTDPMHIQLLKEFSINKLKNVSSKGEKSSGFNGTRVMLKAWPDFNLIKPTSEMIELCALLISKPCRYEKIGRTIPSFKKTELDQFLNTFSEMGVLKITGFEKPPERPKPSEKESSFYLRMKQFLSRKI